MIHQWSFWYLAVRLNNAAALPSSTPGQACLSSYGEQRDSTYSGLNKSTAIGSSTASIPVVTLKENPSLPKNQQSATDRVSSEEQPPVLSSIRPANIPVSSSNTANKVKSPEELPTTVSMNAPHSSPPEYPKSSNITGQPSATTGGCSYGGSKRGLAWDWQNDDTLVTLFDCLPWIYTWKITTTTKTDMTFFPMIHLRKDLDRISEIPPNSNILGYNEPERNGISPMEAASDYRSVFMPLVKSGRITSLISPACANGPQGDQWILSFMSLCADCELTTIATHYYGPSVESYKTHLLALHSAFPEKMIMVTELAFTNWDSRTNPSESQIKVLNEQAMAWLEQTEWITRYAFFGAMKITDLALGTAVQLMAGSGAGSGLTDLGLQYVAQNE